MCREGAHQDINPLGTIPGTTEQTHSPQYFRVLSLLSNPHHAISYSVAIPDEPVVRRTLADVKSASWRTAQDPWTVRDDE